jgi:iron-sulfur cluster assembly accessory protein
MELMGIHLTESAAVAARELQLSNPDFANGSLRLYLDGKGCDGFYYGVTFDQATPTDIQFTSQELTILVDPDTIEFVDGSTITWVDDERGKGFLVENPNHRRFRGKFYKRSAWQQKLLDKVKERQPPSTTT